MDALFVPLATATGSSVDQIKLIFCLLVSYPLGSLFIRIPHDKPNLKHLFNVAVATFFFLPVLELWTGYLQLLVDIGFTYFVVKNVKGPQMPWLIFVFAMGHLTINHAIRAFWNLSYETVEITGAQMVLVMKLTTFAWNVYDGQRPVDELDEWQKKKRVVHYPSFLAFLGYCFYFPGLLVGPFLLFSDYDDLIDGALYKSAKKDDDPKRATATVPGRLVPRGRKRAGYRKMLIGLLYLGAFVLFAGQWNFSAVMEDWFLKHSLLNRILIHQFCGICERLKYYAVWTLTEGAYNLTGLGFSGFGPDGKTRWDDAANINVLSIETASNIKVLIDSWNMKANMWLRECVYKRVTPKGKKPGFTSSMLTFVTSALWHGISSGYYLTFIGGGFAQTVGRMCRTYIRPFVLPAGYVYVKGVPPPPQTTIKKLYDAAGTVCTILLVNYLVTAFMLLTWRDSLIGWSHIGWYGNYLLLVPLAFFHLGGAGFLRRQQDARAERAGVISKGRDVSGSGTRSGTDTPLMQVPPIDAFSKEVENKFGQ